MNHFLIRFSGEIGTKRGSTRWRFINQLGKNIRNSLKLQYKNDETGHVDVSWNHIVVYGESDYHDLLLRTAGIQNFSKVTVHEFTGIDELLDKGYAHFNERMKGKKFAVRARKMDKARYGISRMDLERMLGERLVDLGTVDLTSPEVTCYVEVNDDKVHFYNDRIKGLGGLPTGVLGKALTMLSGGIDSPVATWQAYRTGMQQDFIYFDLGGAAQKENLLWEAKYLQEQFGNGFKSRLFMLDFKSIIQEILKADRRYHNLILKYFFYKTAEKMAKTLQCIALVTGEALGQVSTQTLANLSALDRVTDLLVVRPLAAFPKSDIIKLAEEIGTFEMAYKGKEYCALATSNVVTASTYERLMQQVDRLDTSLIDDAIKQKVTFRLWDLEPVESAKAVIPDDSTIIDLRTANESQEHTFENSRKVPFQLAWAEYVHWEKEEKYFLVCNEGSQSIILKEYMRRDGYKVEHLEGGIRNYLKHKKEEV